MTLPLVGNRITSLQKINKELQQFIAIILAYLTPIKEAFF